jgi:hypothetical protein
MHPALATNTQPLHQQVAAEPEAQEAAAADPRSQEATNPHLRPWIQSSTPLHVVVPLPHLCPAEMGAQF